MCKELNHDSGMIPNNNQNQQEMQMSTKIYIYHVKYSTAYLRIQQVFTRALKDQNAN